MCAVDKKSIWFIEKGPLSMMLFKFHFIVIFMYSTIFIIVLFKIPYKYDRIRKTKTEKIADKKQRAKRKQRRKGRKHKDISLDLHKQILKVQQRDDNQLEKRNTTNLENRELMYSNLFKKPENVNARGSTTSCEASGTMGRDTISGNSNLFHDS